MRVQNFKSKIKNFNRGFTLAELLVALAVFSLLIGAGIGIFHSTLRVQRRALVLEEILTQSSYAFEYMNRAIRMAMREQSAPGCLSQSGLNYEITRDGKGIKFRNWQGICQEFFLEGGQLKESKGGLIQNLTSADLKISSFNLKLEGASESDNLQPKLTMSLTIESKSQKPEERAELKYQTTISQRNLDL